MFDDPEGPNLVVVAGLAALLWLPSLAAYWLARSRAGKWLAAILVQIIAASGAYLALR